MNFSVLFHKPVHPEIARFARYCLELAQGRALPRRRDFSPDQAFPHLGNLYLLEITTEGDYVPGLFGVRMSVLYDEDMTDFPLSDFGQPNLRESLRQAYDVAVAAMRPVYQRGHYIWPDKTVGFERLMVPLTDDDGTVAALLCSTVLALSDETLESFKGTMPERLATDDLLVCG